MRRGQLSRKGHLRRFDPSMAHLWINPDRIVFLLFFRGFGKFSREKIAK
jgi:hypothetical protein